MDTWKDRFMTNSSSAVTHEVNGHKLRFYPNRIGLLADLAEISKPIAHALGTLFNDERAERASTSEVFSDKFRKDLKTDIESADSKVEKMIVHATTPELSEHRRKERNAAIDELLGGLTNTRNRILIGRLMMDSLREEFPYKKDRTAAEVEEFLDGDGEQYQGLDTPTLVQMVVGWLKANSKVFGATGEKVVELVKGKLGAPQNPSPSVEKTSSTDGSNSKKLSLVPLDSDSNLSD